MNDEQLDLLFRVGASAEGLVPADADLPTCESLVKAGVLVRTMRDGEPVYTASPEFEQQAVRLIEHQAGAAEQARLN